MQNHVGDATAFGVRVLGTALVAHCFIRDFRDN